jgi:2-polyprenyl-6-methoxyphenol hydroxylase-like FAD-dependent oxidoreductase
MDRLHLRNRAREIATIPLGDVGKGISPYPFALSYPQDDHERLLIERLGAAGHAVEWGTELVGLTQDEGSVRAVLRTPRGEEEWSGPYLCGCDGAHSAVRHALGTGFPGGNYDQLFYVADAEGEGAWSDRDLTAYIAEKTFCLAFPVREPGMFRFIGLVPDALRSREDVSFDDLRGEVEAVTGKRVTRAAGSSPRFPRWLHFPADYKLPPDRIVRALAEPVHHYPPSSPVRARCPSRLLAFPCTYRRFFSVRAYRIMPMQRCGRERRWRFRSRRRTRRQFGT